MGKQVRSVLVLGEGPTEFYYFNSLRDVIKGLTIKPDYPKHTNLKELEAKIEEGIADGYDHIFCVIDMDTKDEMPERTRYARLKKKYAKPVSKPKKGSSVRYVSLRLIAVRNFSSFIIFATRRICMSTKRSCCVT